MIIGQHTAIAGMDAAHESRRPPPARPEHPGQRCTLVLPELLILTAVMADARRRSRPLTKVSKENARVLSRPARRHPRRPRDRHLQLPHAVRRRRRPVRGRPAGRRGRPDGRLHADHRARHPRGHAAASSPARPTRSSRSTRRPRPGTAARPASTAATPRRRRRRWPTASAWPARRTCSRRSTWARPRLTSPASTSRRTSTRRNVYPAGRGPWLRGRGHRLVRGGRAGGADDGADLRRGPRRPRGLLRAVHRPLDRRAADEQLPAARPRHASSSRTSSAWGRTPTTAS